MRTSWATMLAFRGILGVVSSGPGSAGSIGNSSGAVTDSLAEGKGVWVGVSDVLAGSELVSVAVSDALAGGETVSGPMSAAEANSVVPRAPSWEARAKT
jgi:hypothetical protein